MEEKISWSAESHLGKTLHKWWLGLDEDRASRAVLRRCATIDEVTLSDAYQRFYRYMLACNAWPADAANWQNDKLAAIAGLLSLVKAEDTQRLPIKMSESSGERPLVSELRFRGLLKIETADDLFVSLRRTLPLIDSKANIYQLANDVYYWGDKTKKDWAYSYRWPAKQPA
ncbi:MAG: type I-E CRISPR-associated protein Cse2/CasB [Pseudomonadota bacterium]